MTDRDQSRDESASVPAYWGGWATLGWSLGIIGLFITSQTFVLIVAVSVVTMQHPGVDPGQFTAQVANSGFVLSVATLVSTPVCMGAIAFLIQARQASVKRYLELHRPDWRSLLLWCLITLGLIYGLEYLKSFVDRLPSSFTEEIYNTAQFLPLLYLAVAVAAPLFEEFFFRGFLLQGLSHSRVGPWGAVLISSTLWAVIHLQYDLYDMGSILIFGVVLAIAQLRTHSLYIPIAMHALNNFVALSQAANH
ncbi:MAG: CPBP family intramembrane glutamic endopeptidase [Leptolyngbyaceae bacterium]|nr:CPBP family intramembrane glutamic endopeptidase [Leptolyngbyaceae bacterium]